MLKVYAMNTGDANRHEAARALLRWKYEEIWDTEMPEIVRYAAGKPGFAHGPGFFSLSYSDDVCCCALCDVPIGLDVEQRRSVSQTAVRRILSPQEWMDYSVHPDPMMRFLQYWTLKEAYYKYLGTGLTGIRIREAAFDLSGHRPILQAVPELCFYSNIKTRKGTELVVTTCSSTRQIPEFTWEEL